MPVAVNWQRQDLSRDDAARRFVDSALAEAEPNAVILAAGDERTFALWYAVYGLRRRPDVAVLNVNLYGFDWYRRSLAKTRPDLLSFLRAAPPIDLLVDALAAERPVYAAEDLGPGVSLAGGQPEGVLTRLAAP